MKKITFLFLLVLITMSSCKKDENFDTDSIIPSDNTIIVNEKDWDNSLVNIKNDDFTFTFSKEILKLYGFVVGDIIVCQSGGGYLRKISSITEDGDNIIIKTDFATITEAFKQGGGKVENIKLTPDLNSDSLWLDEGVVLSSLKNLNNEDELSIGFTFNNILYDFDGNFSTPDDQVRVTGSYMLTSNFGFEHSIKNGDLDFLYIKYELEKVEDLNTYIGNGKNFSF